jgi:DNA-binding PadR family transcriptional regulator
VSILARTNSTKYAILGVLSIKSSSGYDIKKFCDGGIAHFWNENYGHIYPMLKQMEEDGWITKQTEVNEGKPPRNVYSITDKGREELADWLAQPTENSPVRLELLLKLTFARNIPAAKVIEEMEQIRQKHISRLEQIEKMEKEFNSDTKTRADRGYPYWLSTIRYAVYDARFRIQWCEETIQNIKEHEKLLNS